MAYDSKAAVVRQIQVRGMDVTARMNILGLNFGIVLRPREHAGKFLFRNVDASSWQLVESVYHALRQTEHILYKQGLTPSRGEKKLLRQLRKTGLQLNLCALELGTDMRRHALQRDYDRLAMQITGSLIGARNRSKKAAADQVSHLTGTSHSVKIANFPADRARSETARRKLGERANEIQYIGPRIAARQHALINLIGTAETELEIAREFLVPFLKHHGLSLLIHSTQRRIVADRCEFLAQDLIQLNFRPYSKMCILSASDLRTVRDLLQHRALTVGIIKAIRKCFTRCLAAITLKNLQIDIEREIYRLMQAEQSGTKVPRALLRRKISTIDNALAGLDDSILAQPVARGARTQLAYAAAACKLRKESEIRREMKKRLKLASAKM